MASEWDRLLAIARRLSAEYEDAVFIGGIAVAQHAAALGSDLGETSHDADLYVSLATKAALRDYYEIVRDERLQRDSLLVDGEDIDLYVELQHGLAVPYEDIVAGARMIDGIRVAAPEHVLILKIDATLGRKGSSKGERDLRDLARILLLLDTEHMRALQPYLDERRLSLLDEVVRRQDVWTGLVSNPHRARQLREKATAIVDSLRRGIHEQTPDLSC